MIRSTTTAALLLLAVYVPVEAQTADMVLTNGLVRTANAAQPRAEAVAVTDGRKIGRAHV